MKTRNNSIRLFHSIQTLFSRSEIIAYIPHDFLVKSISRYSIISFYSTAVFQKWNNCMWFPCFREGNYFTLFGYFIHSQKKHDFKGFPGSIFYFPIIPMICAKRLFHHIRLFHSIRCSFSEGGIINTFLMDLFAFCDYFMD